MSERKNAPDDAAAKAAGQGAARGGSYALLDPEVKRRYLDFYRSTYQDKGKAALDRKTKELIAIAASLAFNCQNCLDGHIKKAIRDGATRREISEAIEVTFGVSAASIVDRSDLAGWRLGIAFDDEDEGTKEA